MKLKLIRYSDNGDSTQGLLFVEDQFFCYTLEDECGNIKVEGETRIPEGVYEIQKREVISGLTKKYREKYDWFDYHLQLQKVPGFNYVYIHIGNDQSHTDGCILVGDGSNNNQVDKGFLSTSTQAFKRLYARVSQSLEQKESITINII